ncbi:MAG: cytochrome c biogenesis heme-transporting ATPase CcmA [Neptuniibacter sp.]
MATELLQVKNLFCERDERVLFENLAFTLDAGEVIQVEGQNGSGKTTLLRILSGLSNNFEGDVFWQGEPIERVRDDFLTELLYFGHHPGVKAILSPEENLLWYAAMHPGIDQQQIGTALEKVGLSGFEDVPCHTLSAGQNRRVSLARLYLSNAKLWILDEPFTAIDKKGVAEKEQLILEHARNGGGVILTTHHELGVEDKIRRLNLDELAGT